MILRQLRFVIDINLLPLELKIGFDHSLDSSHVWAAVDMKCFHKLGHVVWVLPLLHSLEEAEVDEGHCGRAADS